MVPTVLWGDRGITVVFYSAAIQMDTVGVWREKAGPGVVPT